MGFKDIYREAQAQVMRTQLIEPDLIGIQVDVPDAIKRIFLAEGGVNRHLIAKFKNAITDAIALSFNHPDTKSPSGVIRQSEVKSRMKVCFDAAEMAYHDMGMGMIALCDMMPHVLVTALREHFHGSQGMTDGYASKNTKRWGLPDEEVGYTPRIFPEALEVHADATPADDAPEEIAASNPVSTSAIPPLEPAPTSDT